jgi:MFS family permease
MASSPSRFKPPSALEPLNNPNFRMLWLSAAAANVCMWMSEVAAAWLMTSLHTTPLWVALVQTAATLPMFVVGLPCGALADLLDRKRYFLFTQLWVSGVAIVLSACIFLNWMQPSLLLALMFANGLGLAMRWPLFSTIVPELIPRAQLSAALALNSVSMNTSRILGPLAAGTVIAHAGTAWVFVLNACLSLLAAWTISRWQRTPSQPIPRLGLWAAMSQGLQYLRQSRALQIMLVRIFSFFFHAIAIIALLAVRARTIDAGDASTFTILLMSLGAGAISATFALPWLRRRYPRDALVLRGSAVQALAMLSLAWLNQLEVIIPVMLLAGAAWITSANTLTLSMQLQLPDAMRARGMAMYQMAIMGASAAGAALWGQIATWTHVGWSLSLAALSAPLCMAAVMHWLPEPTPARV